MDRQSSAQAERPVAPGVPPARRRGLRHLGLVLLLAAPSLAPAQGGAGRPAEPPGFEFPADAGWQRRTAEIRAERRALVAGGALARLNGAGAPKVQGRLRVAVVPVLFAGQHAPFAATEYQDLLFSPTPGAARMSAASYYAAQSRGALALEGKVFDWVVLPRPEGYYTDGCNGIGVVTPCPVRERSRMLDFLEDALDGISTGPDAATAWNGFDNDGADGIPDSGDDDGLIDLVIFLHPGVDGACGGSGLWSHRFGVGSWNGGHGYQTRTARRGAGGGVVPGAYLTVNAYTLQSAVGGIDACTPGSIMPIGTVSHETGHAFGLPDLYDTDPVSGTSGIGEWGVMGAGNYARPYSPSSFDAWTLTELGWVVVDTLRSGATLRAGPVQRSDTVYLGRTALPGFRILVENRQAIGTDTAMMNPAFQRAKAPGLLIWLIDDARILSGLPINRVNTGARQGVSLIQADGYNQLRSPVARNRGDPGDPWPGSTGAIDLGLATLPAATTWDGQALEIRIDRIAQEGDGVIRFRYVRRAPTLVAARSPAARVRFDGHLANRVVEVVAAGDEVVIGADSLQVAFDGRSAARFLGWSDGGARVRTITARSDRPDSLFADFAVLHRLRVIVQGPGSVTSSAGAVGGSGLFLADGSGASVTATAAPGAEFLGWRGDTTALARILPLVLTRPVDLVAVFAPSVTLEPVVVLRAVMGGPPLDQGATAYLDAVGNRNGVLDIGDYLAWLRRTGTVVPRIPPAGGTP